MRRPSVPGIIRGIIRSILGSALLATAFALPSAAQSPAAAQPMGRDDIAAFAKVHAAIALARDSIQAQLAQSRNKKPETQQALRDKLRAEVEEILHHNGMTE